MLKRYIILFINLLVSTLTVPWYFATCTVYTDGFADQLVCVGARSGLDQIYIYVHDET